jgi:predicted Zn-dependent protease
MQRQLNFSRDAEREADRVGLEILKAGRFDTSGMIAFFGRLQSATRVYGDGAPPYLRSHPMTTERIADIESRIRGQRYRQHADSLDFQLIRARVRILQDDSAQGLRDASVVFNDLAQQKNPAETIAAKYGLALVAQRQANTALAENLLAQAQSAARGLPPSSTLASLGIELRLAANQPVEAEREASRARTLFPHSRGIALQYADALLASRQTDEAVRYLRDQAQLYRADSRVQERLARAYSAQGRQALQHMALAESYALAGSLPSALDQLQIARRAADASFYDQSVIDAREREFQARRREEMKEEKEKGR